MKNIKICIVALLFTASLCLTHASILGAIFNRTKLRGKGGINTNNGLKIDYSGDLSVNLDGEDLSIAEVVVRLNSTPTKGKNSDEMSFRYQGETFVYSSSTGFAFTTDGIVELKSVAQIEQDKVKNTSKTTFSHKISDSALWNFYVPGIQVQGTDNSTFKIDGSIKQSNDKAELDAKASVDINNNGLVFALQQNVGDFELKDQGELSIKEELTLAKDSSNRFASTQLKGSAHFKDNKFASFRDDSYGLSVEGDANFDSNTQAKYQNNSANVSNTEIVKYNYMAVYSVNNSAIASSQDNGTFDIATSFNQNSQGKDSINDLYQEGKLLHNSQYTPKASRLSLNLSNSPDPKVKALLDTKWLVGSNFKIGDDSALVTTNGVSYSVNLTRNSTPEPWILNETHNFTANLNRK